MRIFNVSGRAPASWKPRTPIYWRGWACWRAGLEREREGGDVADWRRREGKTAREAYAEAKCQADCDPVSVGASVGARVMERISPRELWRMATTG